MGPGSERFIRYSNEVEPTLSTLVTERPIDALPSALVRNSLSEVSVKPSIFAYHAPATVEEAIATLAQYKVDARVLAGGQSLLPMMNFRLVSPAALIDLNRINELSYIREDKVRCLSER